MTGEGRNPDKPPAHARAWSLPPQAIGQPVTPLEPAVKVTAWVCRPRLGWTQLDGEANAYTRTAAHVVLVTESGLIEDAWVWAGGVTRR
jgi:hypothetical protein